MLTCQFGDCEGLATARTAIALPRLAMPAHVLLSHLSSGMALGGEAKLGLRGTSLASSGCDHALAKKK
jgi:hypothetical protein